MSQKIIEHYSGYLPKIVDVKNAGRQTYVSKLRVGQSNSDVFKATGKWPPSDYSTSQIHHEMVWRAKGYYWGNKWNPVKWYPTNSFPPAFSGTVLDEPRELIEAISAAKIQKVFNDLKVFDVHVFLAELPEAVSHVASTAKLLVESMLALRKGRVGEAFSKLGIKKAKRVPVNVSIGGKTVKKVVTANQHKKLISKQIYDHRTWLAARVKNRELTKVEAKADYFAFVSERWLELNYGWYPLMKDTDDLVKLAVLGADLELPPVSKTISTTRPIKVKTQWAYGNTVLSDSSLRVSYKLNLVLTNAVTFADYSFGINSVSHALWEAIPLSFVVDWFFNIGNYIENVRLPNGFQVQTLERTEKRIVKGVITGTEIPGYTAPYQHYLGNTHSVNEVYFQRKLVAKLPSLTLSGVYALGGVDNWLKNVGNMATSIALLKTIFLSPK